MQFCASKLEGFLDFVTTVAATAAFCRWLF